MIPRYLANEIYMIKTHFLLLLLHSLLNGTYFLLMSFIKPPDFISCRVRNMINALTRVLRYLLRNNKEKTAKCNRNIFIDNIDEWGMKGKGFSSHLDHSVRFSFLSFLDSFSLIVKILSNPF